MKITFENVMEQVVNCRTISRKDKQNAIRFFLKEHSGDKKPKSEEEKALVKTLKEINKSYTAREVLERTQE